MMRSLRKTTYGGAWAWHGWKGRSHTLILWVTLGLSSSAQKPQSLAYQLRAVFLFNFTQFITWPASSFAGENAPLVIGVLGSNPFDGHLQEIVQGEKVNGRSLLVKYFHQVDEIKSCHVLYINVTETDRLRDILATIKGKQIVTVSDAHNFIKCGGMIKFIAVNHKVHFQINPEALKAEGLEVSSKLLRLAEIVTPPQIK